MKIIAIAVILLVYVIVIGISVVKKIVKVKKDRVKIIQYIQSDEIRERKREIISNLQSGRISEIKIMQDGRIIDNITKKSIMGEYNEKEVKKNEK